MTESTTKLLTRLILTTVSGTVLALVVAQTVVAENSTAGNAPADQSEPVHATPAKATGTNAPAKIGYKDFRIISERNIFNATRSAKQPREERPRKPVVEAFALVGTLSYDKGEFAFFDGTGTAYKKVIQVGEQIGGYTLEEIAPNQVKLKSDAAEIELPQGQQLRREDEGEWKMAALTQNFTRSHVEYAKSDSSRRPDAKDQLQSKAELREMALVDMALMNDGDFPEDQPQLSEKLLSKLAKYSNDDGKPGKEFKGMKGDSDERSVKKYDKYDKRMRRGF